MKVNSLLLLTLLISFQAYAMPDGVCRGGPEAPAPSGPDIGPAPVPAGGYGPPVPEVPPEKLRRLREHSQLAQTCANEFGIHEARMNSAITNGNFMQAHEHRRNLLVCNQRFQGYAFQMISDGAINCVDGSGTNLFNKLRGDLEFLNYIERESSDRIRDMPRTFEEECGGDVIDVLGCGSSAELAPPAPTPPNPPEAPPVPQPPAPAPPEPEPAPPTGPIDLSSIPDVPIDYHFRAQEIEVHDRLERQYKDLSKIHPPGLERQQFREMGLFATEESDIAHSRGYTEDGDLYENLGKAFLDVAVGLEPATGFARSAYELITGNNAVTGEQLADWERGIAFLGIVTVGGSSTLAHTAEAVARVASHSNLGARAVNAIKQAARHGIDTAQKAMRATASVARSRYVSGVATISRELPSGGAVLRGSHANSGFIPDSIGQAMRDKTYTSFRDFREKFWIEMAGSTHAQEFAVLNPENLEHMRAGKAPLAHPSQHMGGNRKFTLHHIEEIQNGGNVYDMSNLVIASPRYHSRVYHASSRRR